MSRIQTLEISKKRDNILRFAEVTLEVDHDISGFIFEIRVWSEYFDAFIPVHEAWLKNNFPVSLQTVRGAVLAECQEARVPQFNNDDSNPNPNPPPSAA